MLDPRIDPIIGAVLVVIILILLIGIIGRVADDHADLAFILALDPAHILVADRSEHIALMPGINPQRRDIIQRIDKAQIFELLKDLLFWRRHYGRIRRLDIQIGHIIRQDRHLIGVQLLLIFVPQLGVIAAKMFE